MSILIKGAKMPKEHNGITDWITVRIYPDGTCVLPNWQGDCEILKGVKAVEIPPHGRLIDADKLDAKLRTEYASDDNIAGVGYTDDEADIYNEGIDSARECVRCVPTVIESEE